MTKTKAEKQQALNEPAPEVTEPATINEHANTGTIDATAPKGESKSIVPSKYANKYKGGGSDPLALFIKSICGEGDKFEYSAFFALCRKNIGGSLTEEKIAHYEEAVASKAQGANGRARMTLRNMLAPIARKNNGLNNLNGEFVSITGLAKPAVSGAAAAAQSSAGEPSTADTEQAGSEVGSGSTGVGEATSDEPSSDVQTE